MVWLQAFIQIHTDLEQLCKFLFLGEYISTTAETINIIQFSKLRVFIEWYRLIVKNVFALLRHNSSKKSRIIAFLNKFLNESLF